MTLVSVRRVIEGAVSLVAPPVCAACDEPAPLGELFCFGCDPGSAPSGSGTGTERLPNGMLVVTTGPYEGALAEAIKRLKYGQRPDLARLFGSRLARAMVESPLVTCDALVPVPLHRHRLAERGYNQSALVAGSASRRLRVRYLPLALERARRTAEQASLGRQDRLVNVEAAFTVRQTVHGLSVVVVDDVVTTGATAGACVAALTQAGARVVAVAALARARDAPQTSRQDDTVRLSMPAPTEAHL